MRGWSTAGVAIVITSRYAHRRTLFISTERSLVESICSRESVPPNKALKLTARSPRPVWQSGAASLTLCWADLANVVHDEHRPRGATAGCSLVQPKWRNHVRHVERPPMFLLQQE